MADRKFELGVVVGTPGALAKLTPERIADILTLHLSSDWGIVGPEEWKLNDMAVKDGTRIFSAYYAVEDDPASEKVWVITQAQVEAETGPQGPYTTVLRPDEY